MSARREGSTTGACAAAAAKAAMLLLAEGRREASVAIPLPNGGRRRLAIESLRRTEDGAVAAVRKDAGDDPDVTNGALVEVGVAWSGGDDLEFVAGDGVGTVMKPGLAVPPGEPAVNPGPRRMIREALREVTPRGVRVTIAIPGGQSLAAKTFNPRLGIANGLSILGTTGIVRPFSCPAVRESIRCAMSVAAAAGVRAPVFVPGHIGEQAARARFGTAQEQVIEVGNEWGFALAETAHHPFTALLALGHPGKMVKLAAGSGDTHSGRSGSALPAVTTMHAAVLGRMAAEAPTVEGIFAALAPNEKRRLGDALAAVVQGAVAARTGGRIAVAVVLIDLGGRILGDAGELKPWR